MEINRTSIGYLKKSEKEEVIERLENAIAEIKPKVVPVK